jgi:hypothetical protein
VGQSISPTEGFYFFGTGFGYGRGTGSVGGLRNDISAIIGNSTEVTATWPNANTKIPVIPQTITVTGPTAARSWNVPDTSWTLAQVSVASDFTTANNTSLQTITGLVFTLPALPATAANYKFQCDLLYSQATAAVADQFGIQAATFAPTNIMAMGNIGISTSATTYGNLPVLATTTATAIVTFTPSAITTVWNAHLAGFIENPLNASTQTVNIMVQTSNGADAVTVKRGSVCTIGF